MKKLAIFAVVILLTVSVFVGCTESYSAEKIDGPSQFASTSISSNGGLSVKATAEDGTTYLYYLNGYGEQTGENVFGKAVKGTILRATVKDGQIDYAGSVVTVVPKNIYTTSTVSGATTASGSSKSVTNKTAGVYTDGKYFYYTTPSTKKNSEGEYKTSEMMLMRTKINGVDSEQIAYFTHYNVLFNVYNDSLVYFDGSSKELHRVNLTNMKDTKIDESVTSIVFADYTATESDNLFFYTKASDDDENPDYSVIYRATVDGTTDSAKFLSGIDNEAQRTAQIETNAKDKGFKYSVVELKKVGDKNILVFEKTDSGANTLSQGLYTIEVSLTSTYNTADEITLSTNGKSGNDDQYSKFYFISDSVVVASTSSATYLLNKTTSGWEKVKRSGDSMSLISSAVTILNVKEVEGVYTIDFVNSSGKVQKMNAFTVKDGVAAVYTGTQPVLDVVPSLSIYTSFLSAECVDNTIIYLNSSAQNYTYAFYLDSVVADAPVYNQENAKNRFISIATEADKVTLIA